MKVLGAGAIFGSVVCTGGSKESRNGIYGYECHFTDCIPWDYEVVEVLCIRQIYLLLLMGGHSLIRESAAFLALTFHTPETLPLLLVYPTYLCHKY